jgi:hypothetical protein
MMVITLSENEERLVAALRSLPPETADRVIEWANHLRELAGGETVEWSDSWSDADIREATLASLQRFDKRG